MLFTQRLEEAKTAGEVQTLCERMGVRVIREWPFQFNTGERAVTFEIAALWPSIFYPDGSSTPETVCHGCLTPNSDAQMERFERKFGQPMKKFSFFASGWSGKVPDYEGLPEQLRNLTAVPKDRILS